MSANLHIRWADAQDNQAILALLEQVPVKTPKESYSLQRNPDCFALTQYQGQNCKIIVAEIKEQIKGLICVAIDHAFWDGEIQKVAYSSELRVHPQARGLGLGEALQKASLATAYELAASDLAFFNTVDVQNPVGMRMNRYLAQANLANMQELTQVRTYFWPTLLSALDCKNKFHYRSAQPQDVNQMSEIWQKVASRRQLARAYTDWRTSLSLPPAQNWIIAESRQEIVAFIGIWDQRAYRQIVLPESPFWMSWLGARAGFALPIGFGVHLCVRPEARACVPELIQQAMLCTRDMDLRFFALALDQQDPLNEWLPQQIRNSGLMYLLGNHVPRKAQVFQLEMAFG